jgi:nitric oxide dioxygenase
MLHDLELNDEEIIQLKQSWPHIKTQSEDFAITMYNRLFYLQPELRPLFKEDIRQQAKKFIDFLSFVISNLDDWSIVEREIFELGKRHVDYRVSPQDYEVVGSAFIFAIREIPSVDYRLWQKLYYKIAWAMTQAHANKK